MWLLSPTIFVFLSGISSVLSQDDFISTSAKSQPVNVTTCNGQKYIYQELAGYGYIASDARDEYGDTIGGIGSSIAFGSNSWRLQGSSYKGTLYVLPDRGWNTQGTLNYQNRIQVVEVTFTPNTTATVQNPSPPNLDLKYVRTILLTDPHGVPTSGLDANIRQPYLKFFGFDLPSIKYSGNGYGGSGSGGFRVSLDSEGLFLGHDSSFWVSDEYGPYVYQFNSNGTMISAIRPPNAYIPLRKGQESFSADSPPIYDQDLEPNPENNPTGRNNNQGFEGLTTNPSGTKLYTLIQSALNQEGGLASDGGNGNARFLIYDITTSPPKYEAEYVVPLPHTVPGDNSTKIAAQSEIHYISDTQFLVLARDSDAGRGQDSTLSIYRDIDVFDISKATNVKGSDYDCYNCQVASKPGQLRKQITPAEYCRWLDFNVNSQLQRFGVHNGGAQNKGLLNEKWESIALVPVNSEDGDEEDYYLFSLSDNDFITQNGYLNFGKYHYKDDSGFNLLNQALVFKVTLPKGAQPLVD